jgi:hypothetical protein
MDRQLNLRRALLALGVSLALGGCTLWERLWGDDEPPVTLLSQQVTLGPEPLVIEAPRGTSAWGSSFWLTVYLARPKVCDGERWAAEEAKLLPTIHAMALTSDGRRHPLPPSECCASGVCGALTLGGYTPDPDRQRRLVRVELSAPQPIVVKKVIWDTWGMQPEHLSR